MNRPDFLRLVVDDRILSVNRHPSPEAVHEERDEDEHDHHDCILVRRAIEEEEQYERLDHEGEAGADVPVNAVQCPEHEHEDKAYERDDCNSNRHDSTSLSVRPAFLAAETMPYFLNLAIYARATVARATRIVDCAEFVALSRATM